MLSTILQKEHATFTNYGLIRMGDARVDAIDDFAEGTYYFHKFCEGGGHQF